MNYIAIFKAANPPPWFCYDCHEEVINLLVHHIDEDRTNNDPSNLTAMHRACHMSLHLRGKPKTPEHREKIRQVRLGTTLPQKTREKIGNANRGKPKPPRSEEHRRKLGDAARGRPVSPATRVKISAGLRGKPQNQRYWRCECGMMTTGSGIWRHQRFTGHTTKEMI